MKQNKSSCDHWVCLFFRENLNTRMDGPLQETPLVRDRAGAGNGPVMHVPPRRVRRRAATKLITRRNF